MNMVRECDSCRSAPGFVYCRADAAVLCTECDAEIHSANLISHRHHRVPLLGVTDETEYIYDEDQGDFHRNDCNYEALFGEEVDEYLDFGEFNSCGEQQQPQKQRLELEGVKSEGSEGVVPVQSDEEQHEMGIDYSTASLALRVSLSSMEANSLIPETTSTETSNAHIRPSKGTIELFSSPPLQIPVQFSPMEREARVLRYREKKKARKFEKTIRYASRKAYAEARPRIKGRFAKRSQVEQEVDQMFSNYEGSEDGYGIVPSF